MNYCWTTCPGCGCEVAIQFEDRPDGPSGSLRRWSSDRRVNDGRKLAVGAGGGGSAAGFETTCVCGATLRVTPEMVQKATTEK